jgi:copper transport protein
VLAVVGVFLSAAPAAAHAALIGSNPPDGAVLAAAPSAVTLRFSESVQVPSGGVSVVGPDGRTVAGLAVSQNGPAVSARLPALQGVRGTYTVSWRVISADTHPVGGAVSFSVGAPSRTGHAPTVRASRAAGVAFGIARFGGFAGVTMLVGAVALCCYGGVEVAGNRRVRRLVVAAWAALVAATFAALALQGPYVSASGLGHVTDGTLLAQTQHTRYGTTLSLRIALLGALPGTLVWAERRRIGRAAAGLLAAGLVATWAMLGHASETGSQTPLTVAADAVHLLAAAVWLGGLAAILAMLWRQAPSGAVVTAVERFSPFAAGCVAVLAATGLYQAYLRVETPAAILTTGYGRLLLVKVALVAAVLAVASRTRAHLHRGSTIALRRLVAAETGGALVVLALTAALVESQPAIQEYAVRPATRTVRFVAGGPGGTGNLTLRLPNTARGLGTGDLTVRSADGHLRDVPELRATWAQPVRGIGPLSARLTRIGTGRYRATWAPLSVDGSWRFAFTIRTSDIDETTTRIPIHIR